jgi:threonine dehydratase
VLVSAAAVDEAAARLRGIVRATPVLAADAIGRAAGRTVLLKPEQLQRTGSFKIRGAYNRIAQLDAGVAVVAASAGNHAQGVALAALLTGRTATIFMPATAPLPKVDATSAYGATIELVDGLVDEAIVAARQHASSTGAVFVPPVDDPMIIAGQGTIGLELLREAPDATTVIVPVGGGGLISGCATVAAARGVRVVGVEPEAGDDTRRSLAAGERVTIPIPRTIADGQQAPAPGVNTFPIVQRLVSEIVTVSDDEIRAAMRVAQDEAGLVLEPSGATGLAAYLEGRVQGVRPGIVLTGGNLDAL